MHAVISRRASVTRERLFVVLAVTLTLVALAVAGSAFAVSPPSPIEHPAMTGMDHSSMSSMSHNPEG